VRSDLNRVVSISSTYGAFAARRSDGTVVTWGYSGLPSLRLFLSFRVLVCGSDSSSPALRKAGAVSADVKGKTMIWRDKANLNSLFLSSSSHTRQKTKYTLVLTLSLCLSVSLFSLHTQHIPMSQGPTAQTGFFEGSNLDLSRVFDYLFLFCCLP